MEAVARTVLELAVHGRRIGVIASPGDRRNEDILALAKAAAPAFDLVLIREDDDLRGRQFGEAGALLRQGLLDAGVQPERILPDVYSEEDSVLKALGMARPGDLVVIFGDRLSHVWDLIVSFKSQPAGAEMPAPAREDALVGVRR
jgi:cyanophycin synthetase